MTDSTGSPENTPALDPKEEKYWDERLAAQPDQLLSAYVRTIQPGEGGQSVTIAAGGVVISGTIVHRLTWMESLLEERPGLRPSLENMAASWAEDHRLDSERPDDDPMPPYDTMVHLIGARIVATGGQTLPNADETGVHWRGRLASVDGWTLIGFAPRSSDDKSHADE